MTSQDDKIKEKEVRRAVSRAFTAFLKELRKEPSTVIIVGQVDNDPDCPVDEVASWLFNRRQDNGRSGR